MKEKYIMFSMGDERIKQLSEALSNPSCRKILDILSEKELTETDISKELKIPLNTVGYNVKKLVNAGLIEKTSHFWSIRGKKMPVYRVSNKKIIISPKKTNNYLALTISFLATSLMALSFRWLDLGRGQENISQILVEDLAEDSVVNSVVMKTAENISPSIFASIGSWQWFLFGAWLGILLFFAIIKFNERRSKNGKAS